MKKTTFILPVTFTAVVTDSKHNYRTEINAGIILNLKVEDFNTEMKRLHNPFRITECENTIELLAKYYKCANDSVMNSKIYNFSEYENEKFIDDKLKMVNEVYRIIFSDCSAMKIIVREAIRKVQYSKIDTTFKIQDFSYYDVYNTRVSSSEWALVNRRVRFSNTIRYDDMVWSDLLLEYKPLNDSIYRYELTKEIDGGGHKESYIDGFMLNDKQCSVIQTKTFTPDGKSSVSKTCYLDGEIYYSMEGGKITYNIRNRSDHRYFTMDNIYNVSSIIVNAIPSIIPKTFEYTIGNVMEDAKITVQTLDRKGITFMRWINISINKSKFCPSPIYIDIYENHISTTNGTELKYDSWCGLLEICAEITADEEYPVGRSFVRGAC